MVDFFLLGEDITPDLEGFLSGIVNHVSGEGFQGFLVLGHERDSVFAWSYV